MFGLSMNVIRWIGGVLLVVMVIAGIYYKGRLDERQICNRYKAEVKALARAQEEKTNQIEVKNAKATEQAATNYRNQLAVLRSHYANRLPDAGTGRLPTTTSRATGVDGTAPNDVLADAAVDQLTSKCAETTLMLTNLQGWVTKVSENTND